MLKIWSPAYTGITSGGGASWEEVRSLRGALEEAPENLRGFSFLFFYLLAALG